MNRNELDEIAWKTSMMGSRLVSPGSTGPRTYREQGGLVASDDDDDKF